ncbi:unnamed protein product [Ixodes persulcatus]
MTPGFAHRQEREVVRRGVMERSTRSEDIPTCCPCVCRPQRSVPGMNIRGKRPVVFFSFGPLVHRFKGPTQRIASAVVIVCLVLFALHSGLVHPDYRYGGDTVLLETTDPIKSQPWNIFFLETSGRGNLTGRMSCAVESAALHHPEWTVSLLTAENSEKPRSPSPFFDLLRGIPNVDIRSIKPSEVLEGTPLSSWDFSGALRSSPHRAVHLADVLRLAVVYKYGGVYLDLDIVVLRSLEDLHNCVSQTPTQEQDMTANGFLIFDRHHPFLEDCMHRVPPRYKPQQWASIGPTLLKEAILSRCKAKSIREVVLNGSCPGVRVLPFSLFLPIYYKEWKDFFDPSKSAHVWRASKDSYVMHVYNALSSETPAPPGCAYAQAAQKYCPLSWNYSISTLGFF